MGAKFLIEVDYDIDAVTLSDLIESLLKLTCNSPGEAIDVLLGTLVAVAVKASSLDDRDELVEEVQDALDETFDYAFTQIDAHEAAQAEAEMPEDGPRTLN